MIRSGSRQLEVYLEDSRSPEILQIFQTRSGRRLFAGLGDRLGGRYLSVPLEETCFVEGLVKLEVYLEDSRSPEILQVFQTRSGRRLFAGLGDSLSEG